MSEHGDHRARLAALLRMAAPMAGPPPPVEGGASKIYRDLTDFALEWRAVGAQDLDHMGALITAALEFAQREALGHLPAEGRTNLALVALEHALHGINEAARYELRRRERKGA